jgi:hypothetical protein
MLPSRTHGLTEVVLDFKNPSADSSQINIIPHITKTYGTKLTRL